MGAQALLEDVPPGRGRHANLKFCNHGLQQGAVGAHQHRSRIRIVLGLGQQILGQPDGISATVREHQQFRGARQGVDAAGSHQLALGLGHETVAGASDEVHRRFAVGQPAQGLGTAEGVELREAQFRRASQHQGVHAPGAWQGGFGLWGRDAHDATHACDLRGNDGHGQGGRVEGPAAGDVYARHLQGAPAFAHGAAARERKLQVSQAAPLAFGEAAHVRDQLPQGGHEVRLAAVQVHAGGLEGGFRNAQGRGIQHHPVQAMGPIQHRRQPIPANVRQNGRHGVPCVPFHLPGPRQRGHPPGQVRPVRQVSDGDEVTPVHLVG